MGVEKVAAFVTRDSRPGDASSRELLVFQHSNPLAGVQIPAGTVKFGESPQDAVLREVAEETGLQPIRIVGEPLLAPLELDEDEWYLDLHAGAREAMTSLDLASPNVRVAKTDGGKVLLQSRLSNGGSHEWWASRSMITRDVNRWLFHLVVEENTEDRWERAFDTGEEWSFYWVPVMDDPGLPNKQRKWLELMRPRLLI